MLSNRANGVCHGAAVELILARKHCDNIFAVEPRRSLFFQQIDEFAADGDIFVEVAVNLYFLCVERASAKGEIHAVYLAWSHSAVVLDTVEQVVCLAAHLVDVDDAAVSDTVQNRHFVIAHNCRIAGRCDACHHSGDV